jgi:hypothetical protein
MRYIPLHRIALPGGPFVTRPVFCSRREIRYSDDAVIRTRRSRPAVPPDALFPCSGSVRSFMITSCSHYRTREEHSHSIVFSRADSGPFYRDGLLPWRCHDVTPETYYHIIRFFQGSPLLIPRSLVQIGSTVLSVRWATGLSVCRPVRPAPDRSARPPVHRHRDPRTSRCPERFVALLPRLLPGPSVALPARRYISRPTALPAGRPGCRPVCPKVRRSPRLSVNRRTNPSADVIPVFAPGRPYFVKPQPLAAGSPALCRDCNTPRRPAPPPVCFR